MIEESVDPFGEPPQPDQDPFGEPEPSPKEGIVEKAKNISSQVMSDVLGVSPVGQAVSLKEALPDLLRVGGEITPANVGVGISGVESPDAVKSGVVGGALPAFEAIPEQARNEAISATPTVQAGKVILPPIVEGLQRSEGIRSSAVMGANDAVKQLTSAENFLNLFTEEGRRENVEKLKGIAEDTTEGIVGGFLGTEKRQFGDELKERGVPSGVAPFMGFAMDLLTDPLTWLGVKGVQSAEKGFSSQLAKEAERIVPDKIVNLDMPFILKPDKTFADYSDQIGKVQDEILRLNQVKSSLPTDVFSKKQRELIKELKQMKTDGVLAEASDFSGGGFKRTPRAMSLITTYLEERGQFGRAIARQIERADQTLNTMRAKWLSRFEPEGNLDRVFGRMTKEDKMNLVASLEGFEKPKSPLVAKAFQIADANRKEIADETIKRGIVIKNAARGEDTLKPFVARENYFSHYTLNPRRILENTEGLDDSLEYAVRTGKFKDMNEARTVWKAYADAVKSHVPSQTIGDELSNLSVITNKKNEPFFNWIVETGQAKDIPEAVKKFNAHMDRLALPINQSLELQRTLNIPFYDVDPLRVLTRYYSGAAKKFGEVDHFGQNLEILNSLLESSYKEVTEKVGEDGLRDVKAMQDMLSLVVGSKTPKSLGLSGVSQFVRNMEAASSLTFAFVMNATQLINTASVVGMKNAVHGFVDAMTRAGKEYAFKSGSVFNEFTQSMYGIGGDTISGKLAKLVMEKLTPFQAIERNNRVVTAIAAKNFVDEQVGKLIAGEGKTVGAVKAGNALRKMGIRPEKVLKDGKVGLEDYYRASQNVGTRTQFRARVQDVPEWASEEWGKIANQFKNFIEQQWKFMRNEIYREAKDGNFAPLLRYSVLAPTAGVLSREIKGILTGKNAKLNTDSDLMNIASAVADVGAFGMLYDIYRNQEYNGAGWVTSLVPAVNDFGKLTNAAKKSFVDPALKYMKDEDAQIIDLKPFLKEASKKTPLVSFFRNQIGDALMTEDDKKRIAGEYLHKALSNNLPSDRVQDLKEGLSERYGISMSQLRKSERNAKKTVKKQKKTVRKERIRNSDNPWSYFGL